MRDAAAARIRYLSPHAPVSMGEDWFDIAGLDHFWVRRRFEIFRKIADANVRSALRIAEIGCGHGLMQRQIEDAYAKPVTGFDLNRKALSQNVSRVSELCCYDIFQRDPELERAYDAIVLFDVLEHVNDEDRFLSAVLFHLKPGGKLFFNVPAFQALWSEYDRVVGHVRRYDERMLKTLAARNELRISSWTYWGVSLTPLLLLRRLWMRTQPKEKIVSAGMDSRGSVMNTLLLLLSRCELPLPNHLLGTSLMAVLTSPE